MRRNDNNIYQIVKFEDTDAETLEDDTTADNSSAGQKQTIPNDLPILPVRNTVSFPFSMMPLAVTIPRSVKLVEDAMNGDRLVGLVAVKDPEVKEPQPGQTYEIGTVAKVEHVVWRWLQVCQGSQHHVGYVAAQVDDHEREFGIGVAQSVE